MKRAWTVGKGFALLGTFVECLLLVGIAVSLYRLYGVLQDFQVTGTNDSERMADAISSALVPTMLGLIIGGTGNLISFLTAILSKYRSKWFFWWSLPFSVVYIFNVIGLAFLLFLLVKRHDFLRTDIDGP